MNFARVFAGNFGGNFVGFFGHTKRLKKFGKFRSMFRKKILSSKEYFVPTSLCRRATLKTACEHLACDLPSRRPTCWGFLAQGPSRGWRPEGTSPDHWRFMEEKALAMLLVNYAFA